MTKRPATYEYRICPTKPRLIQVREHTLNDPENQLWRKYMLCVNQERAYQILAMLQAQQKASMEFA